MNAYHLGNLPTHPSNFHLIKQMERWGWEASRAQGEWVEMTPPPNVEASKIKVRPARLKKGNDREKIHEVIKVVAGDPVVFWNGPTPAYEEEVRKAKNARAAERAAKLALKEVPEALPAPVIVPAPVQKTKLSDHRSRPRGYKGDFNTNQVFDAFVANGGPMSKHALVKALGCDETEENWSKAIDSMNYLYSKGALERIKRGVYRVSPGVAHAVRVTHEVHAAPAENGNHLTLVPSPERHEHEEIIEVMDDLSIPEVVEVEPVLKAPAPVVTAPAPKTDQEIDNTIFMVLDMHILHILIEDDCIANYTIECPEADLAKERECASYTETEWPDQIACRCAEISGEDTACEACLDGEHDECAWGTYINDVGPSCRAKPMDECWYAHALKEVGQEMLDFGRNKFELRVPVTLHGGGWEEPIGVDLVKPSSEFDCPVCEGEGQVAVNFGIDSPGKPEIKECPHCKGTGKVLPETLTAIGRAVMNATVLPNGQVQFGLATTAEAQMLLALLKTVLPDGHR